MPNSQDFNRFEYTNVDMDISRSIFNMPFNHKFSFDVGECIPFFWAFCLPGDTWKINTSKVIRVQPMVAPVMDDLYEDTYYFFVPCRLIYAHWEEMCGENKSGPWVQQEDFNFPKLKVVITDQDPFFVDEDNSLACYGFEPGTIGDYLGVPPIKCYNNGAPGKADYDPDKYLINSLPFKAYARIMDDWFKDENLQNPVNVTLDPVAPQVAVTSKANNDFVTSVELGGAPFIACKLPDYFTTALPAPQRGEEVPLLYKYQPVFPRTTEHSAQKLNDFQIPPVKFASKDSISSDWSLSDLDTSKSLTVNTDRTLRRSVSSVGSSNGFSVPSNLWAWNQANITVSSLRTAFAVQRFMERSARVGSRYIEFIRGFFGVESSDARLQRSEYLGGSRLPLQINQVVQTSGTGESSLTPQGNVTGMSVTGENSNDVLYSCQEFGYIMGITVCRYKHTYQDGIPKHFLADDFFDVYNPVFANLSEMPIKRKELSFFNRYGGVDEAVFGYQEAWADYRYMPNRVSAEMRSFNSNTLDYWHFADAYITSPTLSSSWIREDKTNVDRSLAVSSSVSNQLIADFLVDIQATRPMPLYSIPGLIDHH